MKSFFEAIPGYLSLFKVNLKYQNPKHGDYSHSKNYAIIAPMTGNIKLVKNAGLSFKVKYNIIS